MSIFTVMKDKLLTTCDTAEEKAELLEQIIEESMDHYNGDVELAIKNRFECDMPIDDIQALKDEG